MSFRNCLTLCMPSKMSGADPPRTNSKLTSTIGKRHERLRAGEEGQLPKDKEPLGFGISRKVRNVIIIMESALEQPVSIADLAAEVNISQRQLTRLFHLHTGVTPIKYYCDVRLDRARGLVTQTQLSMLDIAVACGFTSNAQFTRSYKARFGITPSSDRIEGRVPFQFRSFGIPNITAVIAKICGPFFLQNRPLYIPLHKTFIQCGCNGVTQFFAVITRTSNR